MVDLQVVAFPQDGIFTDETHEDLLRDALEMGADLVGRSLTTSIRVRMVSPPSNSRWISPRYDRPVDLHIDETDDPGSRFTEVLASEASKRGIGDRVTASHDRDALLPQQLRGEGRLVARGQWRKRSHEPAGQLGVAGTVRRLSASPWSYRIDELRAGVTVGLGRLRHGPVVPLRVRRSDRCRVYLASLRT